jgi:hypothetical protein
MPDDGVEGAAAGARKDTVGTPWRCCIVPPYLLLYGGAERDEDLLHHTTIEDAVGG